ncbi:MAG TPA: alkaline phosphatase family protein, partial [Nevskia sp.]|nr:alkaline phosphatase family protein [Nevskia sp.]
MKLKHLGLGCAALFLGALAACNDNNNISTSSLSAKHVLLISVDGLHQADLTACLAANTCPTLAALAASGVTYSAARTTTPSDSFPGLLSMVTGGTPKSTGVYYDDSYDRTLFAPGSGCATGPTTGPGIEMVYDESVDYDFNFLFSGGMNPDNLPMAKNLTTGVCTRVYPHNFIKVNTLFEVVHDSGGYTAWSDKHPTYDLVNGPSGKGVDDLYAPEINSPIKNGGTANGVNLAGTLSKCDGSNSLPVAKV